MIKQVYDNLEQRLLAECRSYYGARLVSFCVYGSVGRRTMNPASDIDVLLVVDPLPDGRMRRVDEFSTVETKLRDDLAGAQQKGVHAELSPVFKTPDEVHRGSLLFLDMLEDGRILFDKDRFLRTYFDSWAGKLKSLGAHRVHRGDSWYWVLKEPYLPGEVIEL